MYSLESCINGDATVDTDILKPDTDHLSILEWPFNISSSKGSFEQRDSSHSRTPPHPNYAEPVSEGGENENMNLFREQTLKESHAKELVNGK